MSNQEHIPRTRVNFVNIPQELKRSASFCVWKMEKRNGRATKVPYNPKTGAMARANDVATFTDFPTAMKTYAMGGYDGIGFRVSGDIGAIDIDHCIREDGSLNDVASTILGMFNNAYFEKSPSGTGLRGFFKLSPDFSYDKTVYYINNRKHGLEVYLPGTTNRFVTVTGDMYRAGEITRDDEALASVLDTFMKRSTRLINSTIEPASYLDDNGVLAHASASESGDKFKALYEGNWEELYDSQSDADMALISMLAFWCGNVEEQIDRIFRTSGLMRDKWDRMTGDSTYGQITIRNAVSTNTAMKEPQAVTDAVREYQVESDRIGQFIEAWIEEGEAYEVLSSAVFRCYTEWCKEYNYSAENAKNFKTAMEKRFTYVRRRPKSGGDKTTLILGCKLRKEELGAEKPDTAAFEDFSPVEE